jgi:hypothetical protein
MIDKLIWVKSSYTGSSGNCVEVASLPDGEWAVRDSKDAQGPALRFGAGQWRDFTDQIKDGRLS